MEQLFRFWGYDCALFEQLVEGRKCFIEADTPEPLRAVFGTVRPTPRFLSLLDEFSEFCKDGWPSWIVLPEDSGGLRDDSIVDFVATDGSAHTLVNEPYDGIFGVHFSPDETIHFLENEGYRDFHAPFYLRSDLSLDTLPARLKNLGLRILAVARSLRSQSNQLFPGGPLDPSVSAWRQFVRIVVERQHGARPIPLWPDGKKYCVLLTHDIDSAHAFRHRAVLDRFRAIEEQAGLRSAWMIVTKLLDDPCVTPEELHDAGHEIGFHDTLHDHRLAFLPPDQLAARIEAARPLRGRFDSIGFRSPNYLYTRELFRALGGSFEYDMSKHASLALLSKTKAASVGCASALPFFLEDTDVLEIPNTVPEDVSLELAGMPPRRTLDFQREVISAFKRRGELANIITHPEPYLSARKPWLKVYEQLVKWIATDGDAWIALPRELNEHWRRRVRDIDALWSTRTCSRKVEFNPYPIQATDDRLLTLDSR